MIFKSSSPRSLSKLYHLKKFLQRVHLPRFVPSRSSKLTLSSLKTSFYFFRKFSTIVKVESYRKVITCFLFKSLVFLFQTDEMKMGSTRMLFVRWIFRNSPLLLRLRWLRQVLNKLLLFYLKIILIRGQYKVWILLNFVSEHRQLRCPILL